jgi:hypothetical protein
MRSILKDGIYCFDVNDRGVKKVKNKSSLRLIPVHPEVIRLGFINYYEQQVQNGSERVWNKLKSGRDGFGASMSDFFQSYNRKFISQNEKTSFHSGILL